MSENIRVAIIGGGISGIVSVKECLDEGLQPVCFEQHDQIGGLWYYTEELRPNQGSAIYPSLITNTSKGMTEFSDYPMPKDYPPYVPHDLVFKYLQNYADHFGVKTYVQLNSEVIRIAKAMDHDETGNWDVSVRCLKNSGTIEKQTFSRVIVASGLNRRAFTPSIPHSETFRGTMIHSQQFRHAQSYQGMRVLVIGNANSAADVASDISHHAEIVYMSVGSGMFVMGRTPNKGIPVDLSLCRWMFDFIPQSLQSYAFKRIIGQNLDYELYGLISEEEPLKSAIALNDELAARISCGKIKPKSYVVEFTPDGAVFDDGSEVDSLDAVIFATGYKMDYTVIEGGVLSGSSNTDLCPPDLDLYKYVWPTRTEHNTLAVVGMVSSLGPTPCVVEIQCRWVAKVFSGNIKLPSRQVMTRSVGKNRETCRKRYGRRFRLDNIPYRDEIADIISAKPKFWRLVFYDPYLAFKCYFGPAFPVQYRLAGPHAWTGARRAVMNAYENTFGGLRTRVLKRNEKEGRSKNIYVMMTLVALFVGLAIRLSWT